MHNANATSDPPGANPLLRSTRLPINALVRADVLILLLIFFAFYFFRLSEFSLSIDDEMGALQASSRVWVLTGRWAGYLFDQFLLPNSTVPFFPIFLFGLLLSISYPILLSAFGVNRLGLIHYFAFPLYVALPTWTFLAAFAANIASAGFAQLFVVCALCMYRRAGGMTDEEDSAAPAKRRVLNILAGSILLAFAIGIYQSFVFSFIALSLAVVLVHSLQKCELTWKTVLRRVVLLFAVVVLSAILYTIADVVLRAATNLHDRTYIGYFADWHALIASPLTTSLNVVASMLNIYGGRPVIYGVNAFAFPVIVCLGIAAIACLPKLSLGQRLLALALTASILGVPFLQHFLAGGNMPVRTLVAIPAIFCCLALIGMTSRHTWLALAMFFAVSMSLLQILYSSTMLQAANHFARVHDQELAAAIYTRIVDVHPDFSSGKTYPVDFFGAKHFDTIYPRPFSSTAGFSFFEWGGGDGLRITNYMRLVGYSNLQPVQPDQRQSDRAVFAQMPVWPARDSVRAVGNVTLVKLDATSSIP